MIAALFSCFGSQSAAQQPTDKEIIDTYHKWSEQRLDWPNLAHYKEANALLGEPKEVEVRVVFMGNSITAGWIKQSPAFFSSNHYVNRGISGQTTPQMLLRFKQDVVHLRPEVVVLLCGINDIAENTGPTSLGMIEDNICSMVELARANDIKVVLCSLLPAIAFPWRPQIKPMEQVKALNQWLADYTKKEGLPFVDYHAALADGQMGMPKEYAADGIHPTSEGYRIMEPLVQEGIAKALNGL